MDEISELIAENSAIFDVSDIEREKVYDDLVKRLRRSIKKRSMTKAELELRRALRLTEATKRAANEATFREWLTELNAPTEDEEGGRCIIAA